MTLEQYIQNITQAYKSGIATEHTYRGDLKQLIESVVPDVSATNEPKRIKCGAPDYVLTKQDIPVGFIEAKDVGDKDLEGAKKTGNKEQFDRYKGSLNNLIFTDYLDFHLYIDGEAKLSVKIAEIINGNIVALPDNFAAFTNLIKDFALRVGQTITSSKKLAEMMAGKARMLSDVIERALNSDETNAEDSTLKEQMEAFKLILIHDIRPKEFADVYAQTIAYGMFAARLHDRSLDTFTRQEAAELIPKSNPFLRKLFGYIAGPDIDDRIKWIVDSLANIFRATDIDALLKNFGKATQTQDPIIHFYETFLSEYDPKLRKARGVWFTPEPVVRFIVRAVDDILKTEFNLPQGLADTSKTKIKVDVQGKKIEKEVHKVQILDPATGTGTFLAEVIKHIHNKFVGQQGIWSNYVENHLIPRINGFELLMASYAMAHLKIDLLLQETGYRNSSYQPPRPRSASTPPLEGGEFSSFDSSSQTQFETKSSPPVLGGVSAGRGGQRLQIYLTNSLEEHHPDTGTLFATWLSAEANEANHIKRDTPVMCVIGNPPYSVSSSNKSKWIESLTADYKKDLNERNIQPLSDDYIKFIRFGQHFIDKNGEGVLAYISNNSFIDGIIHRQMRKHLLESFDKIYILDLHGNAKKKEVCPDGSSDQNVFDIMQGVSINIFVKTGKKKANELGKVQHFDLFGKREIKYNFLSENSLKTLDWNELELQEPDLFFVKKNFDSKKQYESGFNINLLFPINTSGIKTHDDNNLISLTKFENFNESYFYRPFDIRHICYDLKRVQRHRFSVMKNMLKENISLLVPRQAITELFGFFVSKGLNDINYTGQAGQFGAGLTFPLYLYPETNDQTELFATTSRTPNLNLEIVNQIADNLQLEFEAEKTNAENKFAPIDILDYIYAVLHSPAYREKYKEFLKIDFPRVPYPKDAETFWRLVKLGGELRQIHLLESAKVEQYITQYPIDGDNVVGKIRFETQPPRRSGTPPILGGEFSDSSLNLSSPPILGGVDAFRGRGGNTHINNLPYLKTFRKELRNNLTPAEAKFWKVIQNKQFEGRKFRRQHSIGNYILDFYCPSEKLAIELDGEVHFNDKAREYDYERRLFLEHYGIKVLRFENKRVFEDLEWMLDVIKSNFGWSEKINTVENKEAQPPRPRSADTPPLEGGELLGRVWINETQYFDNVPNVAWEFYIGGYQPAQKWLKDRKERTLSFDDIFHYQKIIVALTETDKLMKEIDKIEVE